VAFTIRTANGSDVAAIQRIELDAGRRFADAGMASIADAPVPTAAELSPYIRSSTAWVAENDDGDAVGYSLASVVDDEAHIDQVSVIYDGGGQGIGTALIERVAQWGRSHGFDAVTLTTFADVQFNGPLYERLGFAPFDEAELGPELAQIRATEQADGLDVSPRIAMRRPLGEEPQTPPTG
jgi:GNAT superfamily N-acetyltransferase